VEPPARHPGQRYAGDRPDVLRGDCAVRRAAALGGLRAVWVDGALYFTSGPGTLKSRNLAANPVCSVSVRLRGMDLVLKGEAHRVADGSTLERVAAVTGRVAGRLRWEGEASTAPYARPVRAPRPGICTSSRCTGPSAWPAPGPAAPRAGTSPTKPDLPVRACGAYVSRSPSCIARVDRIAAMAAAMRRMLAVAATAMSGTD
jgi:hypothetical protein